MAKSSHRSDESSSSATQRRLIDAAERLFADSGYTNTSVRELTAEAGVNLAAINYHFGGKEQLYIAVFQRSLDEMREHRLTSIRAAIDAPGTTLESLLTAFANSFMEPFLDQGRGRRLMQLYNREMIQPMLPPSLFYEHMIEPVLAAMTDAMMQSCPGLGRKDAVLCQHWFVGQLLHAIHMYHHYHASDLELAPITELKTVIEHIVNFTAAGTKRYTDQPS